MNRYEFFFGLIRIPLEILIVLGAFWISRDIRITTDLIPGIQLPSHTMETWYLLSVAGGSYLIIATIFALQGLYRLDRHVGFLSETFAIIKSVGISFFITIGILYLTNGFPYQTILIPRLILIYAFLMIIAGVWIERLVLRNIRLTGLDHGWFRRKPVLLVANHAEPDLEQAIQRDRSIQIVGYLSPLPQDGSTCQYLGTIGEHDRIIADHRIQEVIVLSHDLPYEMRRVLFEYCQIHGITYRYIGNPYESSKTNAHIDFIGQIPLIEIRHIGLTAWGRVVKRLFDVTLGLILCLVLCVPVVILCIIIMIDSHGSPLYISTRVGHRGQLFRIMKFRTMVTGADQMKQQMLAHNERTDGPLFKLKHDPRITPLGRWLRRWSIDELPQILNVIHGDMSFIGPRPHLPDEVAKYSDKQRQVLTIKPGITGMAQVYGRDQNSFEREVELDLSYIENWSLLLDTQILLLTFRALFQGR